MESLKLAAFWYRKAADQGDAEAQAHLGILYEDGRGVPEDRIEAQKWYKIAVSRYTGDNRREEFVARCLYPDGPDCADSLEADRVAAAQPGAPPYVRFWV